MSREVLTSEAALETAVSQLLVTTHRTLDVFAQDLQELRLDAPDRIAALQNILSQPGSRVRVVLRSTEIPLARFPRLSRLLETHSHHFEVWQGADSVVELPDTLIIGDATHLVTRFQRGQPRGKVLIDESDEVQPYQHRFTEILAEGGSPLSTRATGL